MVVEQWANCGSLADVLGRAPPSGVPDRDLAIAWIEQLAEGLEYAHATGLLHGNMHPGKCLLGKGSWAPEDTPTAEREIQFHGFTVLLGEDSTAQLRRRSDQPRQTQTETVFATPSASGAAYASPARLAGSPRVGRTMCFPSR
jgi:serine/threonine protein kinase